MTFTVKMTEALSWQIVVVVALFVLKPSLLKLIRGLKRVKIAGNEAEFSEATRLLEDVTALAKDTIAGPVAAPVSVLASDPVTVTVAAPGNTPAAPSNDPSADEQSTASGADSAAAQAGTEAEPETEPAEASARIPAAAAGPMPIPVPSRVPASVPVPVPAPPPERPRLRSIAAASNALRSKNDPQGVLTSAFDKLELACIEFCRHMGVSLDAGAGNAVVAVLASDALTEREKSVLMKIQNLFKRLVAQSRSTVTPEIALDFSTAVDTAVDILRGKWADWAPGPGARSAGALRGAG